MKKRFHIAAAIFTGISILLAVGLIVLREQYFPSYPVPPRENRYEEKLGIRDWKPSLPISGTYTALPPSADNSVSPYFPPVFAQIGNSCAQAAGIRYMYTYEMNRLLERAADKDDNIFSYFWTWNFLNGGSNNGTWAEYGLSLIRDAGAMPVSEFPEQAVTGTYHWASGYDKYFNALHYRVDEIVSLNCTIEEDIENIKRYLYDKGEDNGKGGVLIVYTYYSGWKLDQHYSGPSVTGYKSIMTKLATKGAHTLTIAGYDDTVESFDDNGRLCRGAFIAVNTWGAGAAGHDRGKFYIPYHFFTSERTAKVLSYQMIGVIPEYKLPEVVFRLRLSATSRENISITMGVSNDPYAGRPDIYKTSPILWGQGGGYNMQGAGNLPAEIEVALDFTDQLDRFDSYSDTKYFVNVINNSEDPGAGEAFMEYFSIMDYREDPSDPKEYVCEDIMEKVALGKGSNRFSIYVSSPATTSASPYRWRNEAMRSDDGDKAFIIRTADGKYAKARFNVYDPEKPEVEIEYVYQPSGSGDIKSR